MKIKEYPTVRLDGDKISLLDDNEIEQELMFLEDTKNMFKTKNGAWNYEEIGQSHNFEVENFDSVDGINIWMSIVEIYNENVYDLLSAKTGTSRSLKIFSNNGNSYINGATKLYIPNMDNAFKILKYALSQVTYASTGVNSHSSRSHTIFIFNVISNTASGEYQSCNFKFCDLAGAERIKKTGNVGSQLKEAGGINKSLLILDRCLQATFNNQFNVKKKQQKEIVPVRDSKLTFLLQSSITGHEKFVMIVNLYPIVGFLEENINVLKFGSITNQILVKKAEIEKFKKPPTRFSFACSSIYSPIGNSFCANNNSTM